MVIYISHSQMANQVNNVCFFCCFLTHLLCYFKSYGACHPDSLHAYRACQFQFVTQENLFPNTLPIECVAKKSVTIASACHSPMCQNDCFDFETFV